MVGDKRRLCRNWIQACSVIRRLEVGAGQGNHKQIQARPHLANLKKLAALLKYLIALFIKVILLWLDHLDGFCNVTINLWLNWLDFFYGLKCFLSVSTIWPPDLDIWTCNSFICSIVLGRLGLIGHWGPGLSSEGNPFRSEVGKL